MDAILSEVYSTVLPVARLRAQGEKLSAAEADDDSKKEN